jgi:t-SNARE complex subunit (syntaxin)
MIQLSQLFNDLESAVIQQEPAVARIEEQGETVNEEVGKAVSIPSSCGRDHANSPRERGTRRRCCQSQSSPQEEVVVCSHRP